MQVLNIDYDQRIAQEQASYDAQITELNKKSSAAATANSNLEAGLANLQKMQDTLTQRLRDAVVAKDQEMASLNVDREKEQSNCNTALKRKTNKNQCDSLAAEIARKASVYNSYVALESQLRLDIAQNLKNQEASNIAIKTQEELIKYLANELNELNIQKQTSIAQLTDQKVVSEKAMLAAQQLTQEGEQAMASSTPEALASKSKQTTTIVLIVAGAITLLTVAYFIFKPKA